MQFIKSIVFCAIVNSKDYIEIEVPTQRAFNNYIKDNFPTGSTVDIKSVKYSY